MIVKIKLSLKQNLKTNGDILTHFFTGLDHARRSDLKRRDSFQNFASKYI